MARRGRCSKCRYSWRLRKDGTVQVHYLYGQYWDGRRNDKPCDGSAEPPQARLEGERSNGLPKAG